MVFVFYIVEREEESPPLQHFLLQNGVRIPRPKIEELALQAKGAGIFVKDEYPSSCAK